MTPEEKIIRLEERLAHLQRHVVEQDKAMLELGDLVAQLRRELAALQSRLEPASPPADDSAADERPPHY